MKIKMKTIYAGDQEGTLGFYTEVMGFETQVDFSQGPYLWLTVVSREEPDGAELQLALDDNPSAKADKQALFEQGLPAVMLFTGNVQDDYDRIQARGAEFTMPPTEVTGSKIARLNDICGNLIQVTQLMHRYGPWGRLG
jgi:predicted enzyme related to lactoylglutathione lyase